MNLLNRAKHIFGGKKVLLFGLGLQGGGEGVAKFFLKTGAKLTATDLRPKDDFKAFLKKPFAKKIKFVFGRHRKSDFKRADIIIKNPAVPADSPFILYAKKIGKPILSETQIFFDLVPRKKIIGITGTKGKTTTAMLLAHLLKARFKVKLIGNIPGRSALESLIGLKKLPDFFVYELSSFNLEGLKTSPKYAVITNIFPDHLNRYKTFGEYKKVKENIFKYQTKNDVLWFNKKPVISKKTAVLPAGMCFIPPKSLETAQKAALFLGVKAKDISARLKSFKPAEGRMEYLGLINGVFVINDTASTNPESAIFSLNQVKRCLKLPESRIILIAGGENKKLSYLKFSRKIKGLKSVILIPGSASALMEGKNILRVYSLNFAIKKAFDEARAGDCILFSPAAASFNMFKNEFDRGKIFKKLVKNRPKDTMI